MTREGARVGTLPALCVAACAAVFAAACSPSPHPGVKSVAPAEPVAAAPPPANAAAQAESPASALVEASEEVAEALALVARVRELEKLAEVPGVRLDRAAIRREIEQVLAEETPEALVVGNTELLFAFDLVSDDFDLRRALSRLYESELAGFYDPKRDRMVLAADLGDDQREITLYHELVHVLQDQHYDLASALDWQPELTDTQAALQALAEGDATLAMLDVARVAAGLPTGDEIPPELLRFEAVALQATPDFREIPGVIVRGIVAPYADGLAFVSEVRRRAGGWHGVDAVWRDRPTSTEQVLHPDKYFAREPVVPVPPIEAPPGFPEPVYRDVFGEQGLRLLFEEWAPAGVAALAASDWGGDRLAVFADGDRRLVLLHLVFDHEAAARRAAVLFARGALRPELEEAPGTDPRPFVEAEQAERALRGGRFCAFRKKRGAFAITLQGRHVGVAVGPYVRSPDSAQRNGTCAQASALADRVVRR